MRGCFTSSQAHRWQSPGRNCMFGKWICPIRIYHQSRVAQKPSSDQLSTAIWRVTIQRKERTKGPLELFYTLCIKTKSPQSETLEVQWEEYLTWSQITKSSPASSDCQSGDTAGVEFQRLNFLPVRAIIITWPTSRECYAWHIKAS